MAETVETRQIKNVIKGIMRKKGHKYEDLAYALGVSVNTVKRVLNKEDLSLERMQQILRWLGVNFSDVVALCEETGRQTHSQLTEEQEEFLVQNTAHYFIFEELMVGKTVKQIQAKFDLNDQSMQRYLLELDRQNILELHPNGRVRTLIKGLTARRGGVICQLFAKRLAPFAKENVEMGLLFGNKPPKFSMHFNTNLWLRPPTLDQLHKDVQELVKKYTALSATETAVEASENLIPAIWFFVVNSTEINDRLFDAPTNFPDTVSPASSQQMPG